MEVKKIQIETAEKGDSAGLKTLASYEEFRSEVKVVHQITDIFNDSRVKIRQDQNKYIFNINGKNEFIVDTRRLEERSNMLYDEKKIDEERKAEEEVHVRIEGLEIIYFKSKTQEELNDLQYEINQTNTRIEHATNIESIKYKVERLITFFEQEKDLTNESMGRFGGRSYDRKDRGLWKINKIEIKRRIIELEKIKKHIERLEQNQDKKYTIQRGVDGEIQEVIMDDINGFDRGITLLAFNQRIEELGKEAPEFIKTRNEIILENGDTTPYYEIILNNTKDASALKLALQKINNDYITLNKMSLSVDKRQALQQDLKRLQEYLEAYENNPNKPLEPFVPKAGDVFQKLYNIDPYFKKYTKLNKEAGKLNDNNSETAAGNTTGNTTENTENTGIENTNTANDTGKNTNTYTPSPYNSAGEAFEKGGIGGIIKYGIDKTHMKPEQKQFRGGVGNLALTGGIIFVGWKMISSARNLISGKHKGEANDAKRKADKARLLLPMAVIFGSQAYSGEGPLSLFKGGALTEKLTDLFTGGGSNTTENKENGEESNEDEETRLTYTSFPGATALFNGLNYGEMKQFLIKDGDKMKIDPNQYDNLLEMFKNGSKKNPDAVAFLETVGKNDDKNLIHLALDGMGIKRDDIQDDTKSTEKFDNAASQSIVRLRSVSEYMEEKGYNKVNPETMPLVKEFIKGSTDIEDDLKALDERGDVFYEETDIVDKTGLESQITTLAGTNIQRKQDLLLAANSFYDYMPSADKKFDISGTRPTVTFKTYDQTSTINLENKELVGFTPSRFDSYLETFKAANLTNRLKKICANKEAKSEEPFHLSGGDITFDDASIFSTSFDTEMIEGDSLKKISPTLNIYKQEYCDYLNTLKFRKETA